MSPPFRRPRALGKLQQEPRRSPGEAQERLRRSPGSPGEAQQKLGEAQEKAQEARNPHFRRPTAPGRLRRPESRTSADPERPGGSNGKLKRSLGKAKVKPKRLWKGPAAAGDAEEKACQEARRHEETLKLQCMLRR